MSDRLVKSLLKEDKPMRGLQSFFTVSRLIGVLPYDQSGHRISTKWLIYSIIPLIVYPWGCIQSQIDTNRNDEGKRATSLTMDLISVFKAVLQILCIGLHYVSFIVMRKEYNELLESLNDLKMGGKWSKYACFWAPVGVFYLSLQYPLLAVSGSLGKNDSTIAFLLQTFSEITVFIVLMQFCVFLDIVKIHIERLVQRIVTSANVTNLTDLHYKLLETATKINSVYSWQILILCTLTFIKFVSTLFELMQEIVLSTASVAAVTSGLIYVVWVMVNVYFIAASCEGVVEQAEAFNAELFRILRESKNLCSDKKLNLYATMRPSVTFTASGFFSLGYPLVTSIIAAATTYLVILVQFSLPD